MMSTWLSTGCFQVKPCWELRPCRDTYRWDSESQDEAPLHPRSTRVRGVTNTASVSALSCSRGWWNEKQDVTTHTRRLLKHPAWPDWYVDPRNALPYSKTVIFRTFKQLQGSYYFFCLMPAASVMAANSGVHRLFEGQGQRGHFSARFGS